MTKKELYESYQPEKITKKEFDQMELDRRFGHLYDSLGELRLGVMIVVKDDMYGVINKKGEIIVPLEYDYITDFRNNLAIAYQEDLSEENFTLREGLIDTKGNLLTPTIYDNMETEMYDGYEAPKFICGLLKVQINGKFGFINQRGEMIIPAEYEDAFCFHSEGFANVKKGDNWVKIDITGKIIKA